MNKGAEILKLPVHKRYGDLKQLYEDINAAIDVAGERGTAVAAVIGVLRLIEHDLIEQQLADDN
jgi:hypothetical protein